MLVAIAAASAGTILVFGDSLSAGYGLPQDKSWAHLLETRLRDERLNYTRGERKRERRDAAGGAAPLRRIEAHQPDIVVIELGANDGLRGQNLDVMRHNLEAMIDASRKASAQVLLVGMRLPPNYGMAYTEKFRQAYADIARSKKTAFVPFCSRALGEDGRYFQADRVHPTSEAQALMLDTIWKGLKPLLKRR